MQVTTEDTELTPERIADLLGQLTLEEKVAMLAGADTWRTFAVERLGIPALKMSDGPNGARGDAFSGGVTAAAFPAGTVLASSWNTELVERVGGALAEEAKSKGAQVLLGPTVNIHRSPLGGRNFESFSEDPYLTSRMAVAYINGLQAAGIAACVKHYIANEAEFERFSIDSIVDERTLREVYLPPFEAAVREANTWSIMASYNLVNGVAASESPYLLHDILREEWGWDGYTVSDWFFSVKSTAASVNAGLDIEMPGPSKWRGEKLLQAVQNGEVAESKLDESITRLMILLERTGKFANPAEAPERANDLPEHRALIREAAAEGIVLLKNENGVLPLDREALKSIAVIGPNAKEARIMGGGSAQVNAHYRVTPFAGLMDKVCPNVKVAFEQGSMIHKMIPVPPREQYLAGTEGMEHGVLVEYFNGEEPGGTPAHTTTAATTEFTWFGPLPAGVDSTQFAVRVSCRFVPQVTGSYTFGLTSAGRSRFALDGELLIDNWTNWKPGGSFFGMGSDEIKVTGELEAGREYPYVLEYNKGAGALLGALRLGVLSPLPDDLIGRAVELAARSDVALVFAGLSSEWDSEGFDRPDMRLPGDQDELISRVAEANPKTVVVINAGSAVDMPWLDKVAAVLFAWYPGQEAGNAIADLLFGDVNPSAKLPQTFPKRVEDNPSYLNFPGDNGKTLYGERLFVGYRWYDAKNVAPLFPFGFGLSYTTFEYGQPILSATSIGPEQTLDVSIEVTNTGERAGQEVVQLYLRDDKSALQRPEKELKAFVKVALEPGERKMVSMTLDRTALAYFDDRAHRWVAEAGTFELLIGASAVDIRATASFALTDTAYWLV